MRAQYPQIFSAAAAVLLLLLVLAVPINGVTLLERLSRSTRFVLAGGGTESSTPGTVAGVAPLKGLQPTVSAL